MNMPSWLLWVVGIDGPIVAVYVALMIRNGRKHRRRMQRLNAHIESRRDTEPQPIIPGVEYVGDGLGGVWERDDTNRWQLRYHSGDAVPRKVAARHPRGWNALSVRVGPLRPATAEEIEAARRAL